MSPTGEKNINMQSSLFTLSSSLQLGIPVSQVSPEAGGYGNRDASYICQSSNNFISNSEGIAGKVIHMHNSFYLPSRWPAHTVKRCWNSDNSAVGNGSKQIGVGKKNIFLVSHFTAVNVSHPHCYCHFVSGPIVQESGIFGKAADLNFQRWSLLPWLSWAAIAVDLYVAFVRNMTVFSFWVVPKSPSTYLSPTS